VGRRSGPEPSALLPGATHLILEGVYHSPVGATDERPWYGLGAYSNENGWTTA